MNQVERFRQQYEIGKPIFEKLFAMKCEILRPKLQEICSSLPDSHIIKSGKILKTTANDSPETLEVWFYNSCISICPFGIYYTPEHGVRIQVTEFNKFFKID